MEANDGKKWLTKSEVAAHFNCDIRTIGNLMRRKVLPFVRIRRLLRFDLVDCEEAMRQYRVATIWERKEPAASIAPQLTRNAPMMVPPPSIAIASTAMNSAGAVVVQGPFEGDGELRTGVTGALGLPGIAGAQGGTWMLLVIPSTRRKTRENDMDNPAMHERAYDHDPG